AQGQPTIPLPEVGLAEQALLSTLAHALPETQREIHLNLEKLATLPNPPAERNALIASYFRRLRHKRALDLAPEIPAQVGLPKDETVVLLELLAPDTRRDLLRLENLGTGEISRGPVERATALLKSPASDSRALSTESFGNWHQHFSRLAESFGREADLNRFIAEWMAWLDDHPAQLDRSFGAALVDFIEEGNPFGF
ncbi:MAG: hypothetical protein R3B54_15470, partial [Bdellovibrionota bacterium]